jgi:16S rRNA U516 pseudouridylate synthase RsuA-like enzyme
MAEAVGLNVVALHRVTFAGITLKGLSEGNSLELSEKEMKIIQSALSQAEKK